MSNGKTFVKITNDDIYNKLEGMEAKLERFCAENRADHEKIKGTIVLAKWMAGIAIGAAGTAIAWLWQHIV